MPAFSDDSDGLTYVVSPIAPRAHLFEIRLTVPHPDSEGVRFSLPAWIPGSYMIRDFARNIVWLSAQANGCELPVEKLDKQTWRCCAAVGPLVLTWRVYAWELSVRAAHLDQTHAYFNGSSLLLRVHGRDDAPCRLILQRPPDNDAKDWRVATSLAALEVDADGFGAYGAADYADLIDHPVEMGRFAEAIFRVADKEHRVAVSGRHWLDAERLSADLARICARHVALFGELPVERYLFLIAAVDDGYGGLEHRDSTSLLCIREDLPADDEPAAPAAGYRRLLGLCSHEYFHLWNVKRIRPLAFAANGLEREVHSRLLWAFEGITAYYDELALVRAGVIDAPTYLGMLAETISRLQRDPGRRLQTVAQASFDAWTRFYKQDENAPNVLVSYYIKGALVALALDFEIRRASAGRCSLDDLMRLLWQRHGRTGRGVGEYAIEALAAEVAGCDLGAFFGHALDSTEELDLAGYFRDVGIAMRLRPARVAGDTGGFVERFESVEPLPDLAIRLRPDSSEAVVRNVLSGGPGEQAGLAPGDQIVAVAGLRARAANLRQLVARCARHTGSIELHVFRRDELLVLRATPQPPESDVCELMWLTDAPATALAARAAWLDGVR